MYPDPFIDYYSLLGVAATATTLEMQKAYRRLVKTHHPDISQEPDAATRFVEIRGAYETLSDPKKRREYHAFRSMHLSEPITLALYRLQKEKGASEEEAWQVINELRQDLFPQRDWEDPLREKAMTKIDR
jgi:DnaJ-class molecular chaperone